MTLTLSQKLQWLFLGKKFTSEGHEIIKRKVIGLTITGKKYLREIIMEVPETGEEIYHAHYALGERKPFAEWIGPNYTNY